VKISPDLYSKILKKVEESKGEFSGPDDYVNFVLQTVLADEEEKDPQSKGNEGLVRSRLRRLGYQ
jgi:hypothetical protein